MRSADSIYALALGDDFRRLPAQMQEYFSLPVDPRYRGVGTGVFRIAGCPHPLMRPAFRVLADVLHADLFFPDYGQDVPFRIENRAHVDERGRPALSQLRRARFSATTVAGDARCGITHSHAVPAGTTQQILKERVLRNTTVWDGTGLSDLLGRGRLLSTKLRPWVDANRRLRAVSERLRLRIPGGAIHQEGWRGLPLLLPVRAYALQWWDHEAAQHAIQVKVISPTLGLLFVYTGSFSYQVQYIP